MNQTRMDTMEDKRVYEAEDPNDPEAFIEREMCRRNVRRALRLSWMLAGPVGSRTRSGGLDRISAVNGTIYNTLNRARAALAACWGRHHRSGRTKTGHF